MKLVLTIPLLVALLSACTSPTVPAIDAAANAELQTAAPASFEAKEKAATDAARASGENTYAQTCGPVRARFEASNPLAAFADRLAAARAENLRTGAVLSATGAPETLVYPVPALPEGGVRTSAVCTAVFDIGMDGAPKEIVARCSDNRFEAAAAQSLAAARFKPILKNGTPVTFKGVTYPLEFCFND